MPCGARLPKGLPAELVARARQLWDRSRVRRASTSSFCQIIRNGRSLFERPDRRLEATSADTDRPSEGASRRPVSQIINATRWTVLRERARRVWLGGGGAIAFLSSDDMALAARRPAPNNLIKMVNHCLGCAPTEGRPGIHGDRATPASLAARVCSTIRPLVTQLDGPRASARLPPAS